MAGEGLVLFLEQLDKNDELMVYHFGDAVTSIQPLAKAGSVVESLTGEVGRIRSSRGTYVYRAICRAKRDAESLKAEYESAGEQRLYGIVLLSDGDDTNSLRSESEMFATCVPRSESADAVKLFTIAYGQDANQSLLERIANRTNGRAYSAEPDTIGEIFKEIVWEQ